MRGGIRGIFISLILFISFIFMPYYDWYWVAVEAKEKEIKPVNQETQLEYESITSQILAEKVMERDKQVNTETTMEIKTETKDKEENKVKDSPDAKTISKTKSQVKIRPKANTNPKQKIPETKPEDQTIVETNDEQQNKEEGSQTSYQLTISAAGDITIGTDETFGYSGSFPQEVDRHKGNYSYFVKDIRPIFSNDDLTIANLETTLTRSTKKAIKKFRFKGDPNYVQLLKEAGINAVNIANNHIHDYLDQGYKDTITTLRNAKVGYFGYQNQQILNVKGIKVGLLGYEGWDTSIKSKLKGDITRLKKQTDLVIVSFHWGIERTNYPTEIQKNIGHYAVEQGADLVLGHHPHVVQGIEKYKGKYIVYSLGNFLFGGNRNPADKDTFVFQQTFYFNEKKELQSKDHINVIPFSISSTKSRNNYQPTKLSGKEKERVLQRLRTYSRGFNVMF